MKTETRYLVPDWNEEIVFRTLADAQLFADEGSFTWVVEVESLGPFPTGPSGRQWGKDAEGWFELPEGACLCAECVARLPPMH
jgi:hypothetical protein